MKLKNNRIVERITKENNLINIVPQLVEMGGRDIQSLLLRIFELRSKNQESRKLLNLYQEKYPYIGISELDQREIINFDALFYGIVPEKFQAIELSPIGPFGTNATLANINQNNTLSTIRNSEVVSDPTTMLALEAALRRIASIKKNRKNGDHVQLCTIKRVLRLQPFDKSLGYMQHFKCFGACTASGFKHYIPFLKETTINHIAIYLNFIDVLNRDRFSIKNVVVYFSDIRIIEKLCDSSQLNRDDVMQNTQNPNFKPFEKYNINIPSVTDDITTINPQTIIRLNLGQNIIFLNKFEKSVIEPLQEKFPWASFGFNLARSAGIGYYDDFCFHIYGTNNDGLTLQLADGGTTDWTKKLLCNKKELLFISGFGIDLTHKMFQKN